MATLGKGITLGATYSPKGRVLKLWREEDFIFSKATDVEKAYIAGLVDGEGSIGMFVSKRHGENLGYSHEEVKFKRK